MTEPVTENAPAASLSYVEKLAKRLREDRAALEKRHAKKLRQDAVALQAFAKANGLKLDANASAFLARQLLYVRAEVEVTIYETLRLKQFVPVTTEAPRWAKDYATERSDYRGEADVGQRIAHDAPRVDVNVEEEYGRFVNVTASYGYDVDELEASIATGRPLSRMRAMACAEVIARRINKIMRSGEAKAGLTGFFNNPNVPVLTLSLGEWLTTTTVDDFITDFAEMEQALISSTKDGDTLVPGTVRLVLPTNVEGVISAKRLSTDGATTVKEYLEKISRLGTKIYRLLDLDSATGSDIRAADAPQGILYSAHPRNLFCEMPVPYEEFPPESDGATFVIRARGKVGGVDWRRPFTATYVENFD
jgi:hypothetical protein